MIPATAHFLWFGREFPFIFGLALRSAALRGEMERVVLHHADPIAETPGGRLALETPAVEARPLHPEPVLDRVPEIGGELVALYRRLTAPAARANMIRAALLHTEGGVYLDTDTVTLRSLRPLLDAGFFCGEEHLCLPADLVRSRHPLRWARAGLLLALRDGLRRWPEGYRWFPAVRGLYGTAPNNAVVGGAPGHPLLAELLRAMVRLDPARQTVRYALGTHLLTEQVARARASGPMPDLHVHPPEVFYPLGPEISEHWFRLRAPGRVALERVLSPDTRVVHWYASVRTRHIVPQVDAAYIRAHARRQLFSALVAPLLP